MAVKKFKPMIRPMIDQPVDIDLFTSIYDAVNSLNNSDVDYIIDNWAEPWGLPPAQDARNKVAAKSSSGLKIKVVAGIVAVHDGSSRRRTGKRTWNVNFPASASFTAPPVVVVTPVFVGQQAEPAATCIQWTSRKGFRVHAQSIDNRTINISHWSYIACGF